MGVQAQRGTALPALPTMVAGALKRPCHHHLLVIFTGRGGSNLEMHLHEQGVLSKT